MESTAKRKIISSTRNGIVYSLTIATLAVILASVLMPGGAGGLATTLTFPGSSYTYAMSNAEFVCIISTCILGSVSLILNGISMSLSGYDKWLGRHSKKTPTP